MAMIASSSTMSTRINHRWVGASGTVSSIAVTPGHPLCFHVGTKLRGKGVNNARPQPQARLILRRPLSRVGDGELQGVSLPPSAN